MKRVTLWLEARLLSKQAMAARARRWMRLTGPFLLGSAVVHVALVAVIASWTINELAPQPAEEKPLLNTEVEPEIAYFQIGTAPMRVSELNAMSLAMVEAPKQKAKRFDDSAVFEDGGGGSRTTADGPLLGGFGGFLVSAEVSLSGTAPGGAGGVGIGLGPEGKSGHGGHGEGYGGGGHGSREETAGPEQTEDTERAVGAALNWLHRHQLPDGRWSLRTFTDRCTDPACSGCGHLEADTAATAFALLPFIAAEQSPTATGPYLKTVKRGVDWLVIQQQPSGDLSGGCDQAMYAHAIATLAVCEAARETKDPRLTQVATLAVHFIETSQNQLTGGWELQRDDGGDTFNTGWQVLALNSAQRAGILVKPECLIRAASWFQRVSHGVRGGLISYVPEGSESPNMTAIGLLARQYLGTDRQAPPMIEAVQYLKSYADDEAALGRDLIGCYFLSCALDAYQPAGMAWEG